MVPAANVKKRLMRNVSFGHVTSKLAINQFRALLVGTVDDPGESDAESERMAHWQHQSEVNRRAATRSEPAAF